MDVSYEREAGIRDSFADFEMNKAAGHVLVIESEEAKKEENVFWG